MVNLVLFIPGFLSPKARWAEVDSAVDIALPALELLLVRASHTREAIGEGSYEAALCKLFGIEPKAHGDLPIAALTHLVDFEGDHAGVWIRADPVYLRPDLGKLLLFDSSAFHVEKEEAETLIREINPILGQQGRPLSFGKGWTRWYLRLPRAPQIETYPPSTVTRTFPRVLSAVIGIACSTRRKCYCIQPRSTKHGRRAVSRRSIACGFGAAGRYLKFPRCIGPRFGVANLWPRL